MKKLLAIAALLLLAPPRRLNTPSNMMATPSASIPIAAPFDPRRL